MLVILGLAAAVIAVVVMGMEGTGRTKHPEIADAMARTARHLNGEGQPPRGLMMLFDEVNEVSAVDLDPRKVSGRIKESLASARSARSAASAASADVPEDDTALTADVVDEDAAAVEARDDRTHAAAEAHDWSDEGDEVDDRTVPQDRVRAWLDSDADEDGGDDTWLPAEMPSVDGRDAETADDMARALESDPADAFDDPYGVVDAEDDEVVHVNLSRKQ